VTDRPVTISLRLTKQENDELRKAAYVERVSVSDVIRQRVFGRRRPKAIGSVVGMRQGG
jgi:uncharacterized protein (DUF1778 family)